MVRNSDGWMDGWTPSPGSRQIRGKFLRKNVQLITASPAAIMFGGLSLPLIKSEVDDGTLLVGVCRE